MSYRTGVITSDEFGRQAQTFDHWVEKADDQVTARSRAALGRRGQGNLLDVACGPGVVTAAITRGAASVIAFRNRGDAFTR
jgi:2-polyprenyl-3-methyl-5-hydroxy-6-metoxy-1,4-benzoquinol methylase